MIKSVLGPLRRGEAVNFRPPAWEERSRPGAVQVPGGCSLVLVEGVGAGRWELMPYLDAVIWVQADLVEAKRRCIDREGGGEAAVSFWHEWMAQELPFLARQRPWDRANVFVAGTPERPHGSAISVLSAAPALGDVKAHVS